MTFFARPNLDNTQFKQLKGSTLSLSGQTQILTTTGLTLIGDSGNIPIHVTGETNNYVLTYDSVFGAIRLKESSASGGTGLYDCASPTSCSVGGLSAGTVIFNSGVTTILECILVPTLCPTLTPEYASLTLSPTTTTFEFGCEIAFTTSASYNAGVVDPVYGSGPSVRTGLPNQYSYVDFNGTICTSGTSSCANSVTFASRTVSLGTNSATMKVSYDCGESPLMSNCTSMLPLSAYTCTAGTGDTTTKYITGVLPWYWGTKKLTNTISGDDVATGGTKGTLTTPASSTLPITYNSASDDYLWFAIPTGTTKTAWFVCASNQGVIGGSNNLFAAACCVDVTSAEGCWGGCTCAYNIYASCLTTGTATDVPMCMS